MASPAAVLSIIVEANTGKAKAELERFNKGLDDKSIKVTATIDKSSFARAKQVAGSLGGVEEVNLKADVDQGSFARARAAEAVLTKESSKLSDVFDRSNLSIGQWTGILASALPVIVDMTGALGALTASAAAATAGLGALAVGGAGAGIVGFGGIASIAAPAIARLKDLKTAQDAYTLSVKQYGKGSTQAATALAKLEAEQKLAGTEASKFADNLRKTTSEWRDLTKAGQGDFFGMLNDGIDRLNKKLPLFAKSANESMKALRGGFDAFLDRATGPGFNHFIEVMTVTFAKAMKPIAAGFGNIAIVLERIAVAVAPDILRMVEGFKGMTQGWVDSTRNAGDLRDTVHELVNQANEWWKLIKATAGLIAAVLIPGMGQGKKAVEGITASIKGWTDWVNAHPAEMRDFFKEGLKTTAQLFEVLTGFLPMLFQISAAMRPIARAFLAIVKGLNSLKIGNVSALTVLLGAMVGVKVAKGVAGMVTAFNTLKTAALGAATAEAAAASVPMGGAAPKQMGLASAPVIAPTGIKGLAGDTAGLAKYAKVAGGAALAITALVGAIEALRTNFLGVRSVFTGFLNHALVPLTDAFTKLIDELSGGHASEVFGAVGKAFKVMAKPLGFVVRNLTKFIGLLAIGGVAGAFATAMVVIIAPLWVFIKAMTLVVKGLKKMGSVAVDVARTMAKVFTASWGKIKDVFQAGSGVALGAFKRFGGGIHDVADAIGHTFRGLYLVIKKVATWIGNQVNKVGNALGGLKDKIPDLGISIDLPKIPGFQRGGQVPGAGVGDKVPAMLEPGEGVINKKAVKAMGGKGAVDKINRAVPRFQKGGVIDRTGVQHFAKGGMAAMVKEANRFESHHFPYSWGGGHGSFGIQPVDCSGAVSDILHAAGLLNAPMTSGGLMNWGKPGKGPLTVYANPEHVVMSLNGRVFGTSGSNPGGGAGWIDGAKGESLAPGAVRTMDVVGGAIGGQIKKLLVKGKGPVKDVAQLAVNKMRALANAKLAKMAPAGQFGGGQASIYKGNLDKTFPSALGEPPPHLAPWQAAMLAEKAGLPGITYAQIAHGESNFSPGAISNDGGYGLWQMTPRVQSASTVNKWKSIGSYFNPWNNAQMAKVLAGSGTGVSNYFGTGFVKDPNKHWHGEKNFAEGGVVGPYVGSFAKGGRVARDGLAHVHKGEHITPMERLEHEGRVAKRRQRRVEQRIRHEERQDRPDKRLIKHLKNLEERIQSLVDTNKELIDEQKTLRGDLKEHNRLVKTVRANEKGALQAVVNLTSSQIGAQGMVKGRNASPGRAARY